jgi:outer membrane scaffolding protein for murein synthesis (MipA/OmpV family)
VNVSLAYTLPVEWPFSVAFNTSVGYGTEQYNGFYFGVEEAALNDWAIGATATWAVTPMWTVVPSVTYTTLLDSDVQDAAEGLYCDGETLSAGLKVTCLF